MMGYDFQPRIPLDYVVQLVNIFRGTVERERGDVLMLCGATLGEIGALIKQGLVSTSASEVVFQADAQFAAVCEEMQKDIETEPNFDITPWIPLILQLIQFIIDRRKA